MFHRPLLKAATHHRYNVSNMCSNPSICPSSFLQAYNATPFKWLKLVNRTMYSSEVHGCTLEWMKQTLFTSRSTTVTACRVKTEGAKTGLLSADDCDKLITNTTTPQHAHIIPWCQRTQSLRVLHFFSSSVALICWWAANGMEFKLSPHKQTSSN